MQQGSSDKTGVREACTALLLLLCVQGNDRVCAVGDHHAEPPGLASRGGHCPAMPHLLLSSWSALVPAIIMPTWAPHALHSWPRPLSFCCRARHAQHLITTYMSLKCGCLTALHACAGENNGATEPQAVCLHQLSLKRCQGGYVICLTHNAKTCRKDASDCGESPLLTKVSSSQA